MQREEPVRALIVSATVGAGDAGNARELSRRLEGSGHQVTIKDFLEAAPLGLGKALSKGYEAELKHAPWAYELAFGLWYWAPFLLGPLARLLSLCTRRRLLRWVRECRADIVVSTYPIATQVLGDLRRRANKRVRRQSALHVPAVNFITDFGYHPFWAHRDIDLNMAVHPSTVAAVAGRTGRPAVACAPLVPPKFAAARERRLPERKRLGLEPSDISVLISSGSWGLGTVRETLELIAGQADLVPIVACGRNEALREELSKAVAATGKRAIVLGWTDDMPALMAASDLIVENAGGLTSLEAMAAGVPLVSFRPIPGHGRTSAAAMQGAGVSRFARTPEGLVADIRVLGRVGEARDAQLRARRLLFTADAAEVVARIALFGPPPPPRLRPIARVVRTAYAATLAGAVTWVGMTTGVGVAAAAGAGVAHPPAGSADAVYIGVRLDAGDLVAPAIATDLREVDASAVVDLGTARAERPWVHYLAAAGIDFESGGTGERPGAAGAPVAPWSLALSDSRSVRVLSALAGRSVPALVPDRSISAFDLVDASSEHLKMIVPNTTLPVTPGGRRQGTTAVPRLDPGHVYVIDARNVSASELGIVLNELARQLKAQHLKPAPLSSLQ